MPHTGHHDQRPHKKQHRRHTPRPQKAKHQRSKGQGIKDEPQTRAVKGGDAVAQVPMEQQQPRLWSRWLAGDDGRWFYQARPKADGSGWEYQFTEGYPSVTRRQGVAQQGTYNPSHEQPPQATPAFGVSPTQSQAVHTVPVIPPEIPPEHKPENADGEEVGGDHQEEAPPPVSAVVPQASQSHRVVQEEQQLHLASSGTPAPGATAAQHPAPKSSISGNARGKKTSKSGGSHRKKKLNVVVKAEKDLKFNPKKIVKGWLNEVDA